MSEEEEENLEDLYKEESESLKETNDEEPIQKDQSVDDFIQENTPTADKEDTPKEDPIEVSRDKTFDENPSKVDAIMSEVLIDTQKVDITVTDRQGYLKAVLNDMPVKLDVELCAGQIKYKIRSRTSWEQTCLYAALQKDQEEEIVKDLASVVIQLQKYGCVLMVESINGTLFSKETIPQEMSVEDAVERLRTLRREKIEPMSMPKWGLMLNALRLFESKLAKMGTECLNENFWEPAD